MERSKELSFSVRNSGDAGQPTGCVGSTPGFVGDLQLLAGDELEARLQIHDRIGGGSSARVYRGTLDGATPVAVKVLHPHAAQRESTLQEFLREAQVLARLQSKHIVRLHALAHLPPNFAGLPTRRFTWGIVTELMEAGTLTKLVQYAAKVYKQQQRVKQQLAASAAAGASIGGASNAGGPDRSNSLRNLRQNLSFLRRRSLTTGGNDSAAAPPSPRTRGGGGGPVSPSGGGGAAGLSARLDSLTQGMPSLPYTDREALQWCMEVALALQFLHAQTPPVVHRDVKTDNVLMAPLPAPPATAPQLPLPATVSAAAAAAAAAGHGTSFTAGGGGGSGTFSSHGSLARRVLSVRAAAGAGEGASSRHGSITAGLARPGDGRPLTAKLCDFGLHVVLDLTRPVVTVRRRSYESSYPAEALAMAGGGSSLPHSNSLTRRSTRHSPAGALLSPVASLGVGGGTAPGASGTAHTHSGVLPAHHGSGGVPGGIVGRILESRSRRSSLMSIRAPDDNGLLRRAVSRDGDSFSRTQIGVHRNLSHADSLGHQPQPSAAAGGGSAASASGAGLTHAHLAAVDSAGGSGSGGSTARSAAVGGGAGGGVGGIYASSPPKAGPFAGGAGAAAAAAAAAAAFGSTAGPGSGIGHISSGAMGPVLVGLRGSGGGAYRSPKTSGPGSGPGPPKWSGGSVATAAAHGGLSGFAATRASLDMLLQGRLSTTAVAAASHSNASTNSVMIATGGGGSQPGGGAAACGGGGSTAPLLPTSISHAMAAIGGGMESFSAGQMMLQLHGGSNTGMLDRGSRLRPSHAGPSMGDLGGGGGGMTLESALRIANRSSSGRPSIAAAAALMAASLGAGGGGPSSTPGMETGMYGGGTAGAAAPRAPRPSGGSPATSSRGGTRLRANLDLRGNAAQVEKYLAMMEEDLQLDISSRSSSKVQAEMEPLYGPGSRPASQTAAGAHHRASSLLGAGPSGGIGGTISGRRLLSAGQSQGSIPVSASLAQHLQQQQGAIGPPNLPSPKASVTLPAADRHPPSSGAPNAPTAGGGGGGAAAAAPFTAVPVRLQASGSGSGSGAVTSPPGIVGRISSVGPNSPSSPSVPVPSTASTRSEQGMIVLTGVAYSGFGGHPAGSGSGTGLPPGGSGGSAAAIPSGLRSTLLRGPNPMKASSQPAMSISSSQAPGLYPHGAAPSPARGPNPMKSSSQPAMSVSGSTLVGVDSGGRVRWPPPAAAAPPPPPSASTDRVTKAASLGGSGGGSGSGAGGSGYAGGTPSPSSSRGPNPVKSSSQPVMSIVAMTAGAGGGAAGAHGSASRGRDIMGSAVSAAGGTLLAPTTSNGSRMMNHLALAAPSSPTGSVHAMDLSPPAARVKSSSRMGQGHSHASPSASAPAPAAAAVAEPGATAAATGDADLPQRENSAMAITNNTAVRRGRPPLEVFLPGDAPGTGGGCTDSAPTTRTLSPASGTRAAGAGGETVAVAAAAGRQWIATVTAAASPRTHSPAATPGGGGGGPGMLLGTNSGGADSSILPLPPIVHAAGGGGGSGSGVALNRELHKVVKRLRPDGGGGSFTGSGNSPLGLPPTVPMHHGNAGAASGGGGEAGGGSFTCSRRTSMDSHAPSYQSIGSSRSATAALQLGGSAATAGTHAAAANANAGGPGMLHREKLLLGRGLLAASGSAGQSSGGAAGAGGGGGGLAHSGPVQTSGVLTSDPNSPVSSYSPAVGSGSLLGRGPAAALRHHQMGHLVGSSAAAAAAGGSAAPRTTSGGISASGNSARQSSAGERSARQSSLVRQSSSTHSWGDYGAAGGGAAAATAAAVAHVLGGGGGGATASGAASGAASPSRANTATSLRNLGHPGGGGSGTGGLAAMASAISAASGGAGGGASGHAPSALASPMLAHVTGAGSQVSSSAATSIGPQRLVSESAASSTLGGWTGRDEIPPQGEAAYALTGRAGTLLYMAPEVIRHEAYNEKVDVFSFGVVLYEVFGRVLLLELYSKDELEALSGRIAQGFRHSRPDCMPQAIWDLVQQCWAQNPADRPGMPLVVRHMELALEAMDEAEAAVVVTHSGTHRAGSLFGDVGGGAAASGAGGAASGGAPASGSPLVAGTGGTGPGSAATAGKDRSSCRSGASHRSLLSLGGSLGRRSKGLSFRRRGGPHPRSPPQPTAPTPGRPPPAPANAPSLGAAGGGGSSGAGQLGLELPGRALSAGSGLHSPTSRGSTGGGGGGDIPGADGPLRCAPCGCVIC